jgi:hypothetical protein
LRSELLWAPGALRRHLHQRLQISHLLPGRDPLSGKMAKAGAAWGRAL